MSDLMDFSPEPIEVLGRWRFLDGEGGIDAEYKAATIKKIDQFWKEFRANPLFAPGAEALVDAVRDWMLEHLATISPDLDWEASHGGEGLNRLSICRGGRTDLMPVIETMVDRAGEIKDWVLKSYRVPVDVEDIGATFEARTGWLMPPFRVTLTATGGNAVDVTISSSAFDGVDSPGDLEIAFVLTEIVLGEDNLNKWVNVLETREENFEVLGEFDFDKAVSDFANDFADIKQEFIARLPDVPYAQIPLGETISLIEVPDEYLELTRMDERCRYSFLTPRRDLILGFYESRMFFSERFSKHGEKFAYLHLISDQPEYSDEYRERLEASLEKLLASNNLGCLVGTGRGKPDSYYFDLSLTDPDKAIPTLRQFCLAQNLPKTCWLRFYDYFWNREWVRMLPGTPDLKNPTMIW